MEFGETVRVVVEHMKETRKNDTGKEFPKK